MSRRLLAIAVLALGGAATPLVAQDTAQAVALEGAQGRPPERIDILVPEAIAEESEAVARERYCESDDLAGTIAGEIVVCRRTGSDTDGVWDREEWERRYAEETMNRDNPQTPNPCGPMCGIFEGEPTIGGQCIPGLQKCPPAPAYFIDFDSLPETPPGSDADRIARGLAPRGIDNAVPNEEQLALPPPPQSEPEDVSRAESAAPEAER